MTLRRNAAALAAVATLGLTAAGTPSPSSTLQRAALPPELQLVATQSAIMMNGTFTPDVTPEFAALVTEAYLLPLVGPGYTAVPLRTPESLWPFSGLTSMTYNKSTKVGYQILDAKYHEIVARNTTDGAPDTPMLVFGYSQSAFISSIFNQGLSDERSRGDAVPPTTFVLVGNTNVPNGGLMSRFNGLGLTPWTPLVFAPTGTGSPTYDICRQHDPFCDFPAYPLNALAVANTLMGYLLHFTLPISGNPPWLNPIIKILNKLITPISLNPASPDYVEPVVSTYQDTIYEFVPTAKLPLLQPLYALGLSKLANALDPVLRPLVEVGYARDVSFGVPIPASFRLLPPNLGTALQQSWKALVHLINPAKPAPVTPLVGLATATPSAGIAVPAAADPITAAPATDTPAPSLAAPSRTAAPKPHRVNQRRGLAAPAAAAQPEISNRPVKKGDSGTDGPARKSRTGRAAR